MFSSLSKILWTHFLWNTRSSGVAISILSIYTISQPSQISSSNMAFIMAWKVAGELVIPKNMTVGLYNPSFVMKAAFHSSPSLICTLLYPQRTLNLVKSFFILTWLISCGIMSPASRVEDYEWVVWLRTGVSSGNRPAYKKEKQKMPCVLG